MMSRHYSLAGSHAGTNLTMDFLRSNRIPALDPHLVAHACSEYDVVLFNWALHYSEEAGLFERDARLIAPALKACRARKVWLSHVSQHFAHPKRTGFFWGRSSWSCAPAPELVDAAKPDFDVWTATIRSELSALGVHMVPPWHLWGLPDPAPPDPRQAMWFVPLADATAELHDFHVPRVRDCTHYAHFDDLYVLVWDAVVRAYLHGRMGAFASAKPSHRRILPPHELTTRFAGLNAEKYSSTLDFDGATWMQRFRAAPSCGPDTVPQANLSLKWNTRFPFNLSRYDPLVQT